MGFLRRGVLLVRVHRGGGEDEGLYSSSLNGSFILQAQNLLMEIATRSRMDESWLEKKKTVQLTARKGVVIAPINEDNEGYLYNHPASSSPRVID